jgi:succinoglycan biosynthesis protein ExoW
VIIEQANAGPGAARNRGLDATPDDVEYIAFLDSDDRWLPGHLANGITALRAGAALYFSDYSTQPPHWRGITDSLFSICGFNDSAGIPIEGTEDLFFYKGDFLESLLIRRGFIATPTVIIDRSVAPSLRFPVGLISSEDTYFWLALVQRKKSVAFSTCCEVVLGAGVSISGAAGWGSPLALKSVFHEASAWSLIATDIALNADQVQRIGNKLGDLRVNFAANLLHLLRRGQPVDWQVVAAYLRSDPRLIGDIVTALGKGALRLVRGGGEPEP